MISKKERKEKKKGVKKGIKKGIKSAFGFWWPFRYPFCFVENFYQIQSSILSAVQNRFLSITPDPRYSIKHNGLPAI